MARSLLLSLLAAVAVLVFAAPASAHRASCIRPSLVHLPRSGAVDVPVNAFTWTLRTGTLSPDTVATFRDDKREPDTTYTINGQSFTTGTATDTTPPSTPQIVELSLFTTLATTTEFPTTTVRLAGHFSPDTAWIQVRIVGPWGPLSLALTPRSRFVCADGVALPPGDYPAVVRAVDIAGNTSSSVTLTVHVEATKSSYTAPRDRASDDRGPVMLIVMLLGSMVVGFLAVRFGGRSQSAAPMTNAPLAVAEAAIKMLRLRHIIATAISAAITALGFGVASAPQLGLLPGIVLVAFAGKLMGDWQALRNARIDRTIALRRGTSLILQGPWGSCHLRVSEELYAAAERATLPTASLRSRDPGASR